MKAPLDVKKLQTLDDVSIAHAANRYPASHARWGRTVNDALRRRLDARARELAIEVLGYAPEAEDAHRDDRYAATTSELVSWANARLNGLKSA